MRHSVLFFTSTIALFNSGLAENVFLIAPDSSATGSPIAVVWIVGEGYEASQYTTVAREFQEQAAKDGLKAWIGIPDFTFSTPNPGQIESHIQDAMNFIGNAGFTGNNWFLAAHSLGGVMTQQFLAGKSSKPSPASFKGQVLMSSVLLRGTRAIQNDGSTKFTMPTPTLTIGGTKDGLMRLTRVSESYYHQVQNIISAQKGLFPVTVLEGVSHAQFGSGTPPSFVQKNDLRADISDTDAHIKIGQAMATFIKDVVATGKSSTNSETVAAMKPFIEAMIKEGSSVMKPPCNADDMVNPTVPTCIKGSSWINDFAVPLLVGKLQNSLISVINDDNFHPAAAVYPYHHPLLEGTCALNTTTKCSIKHTSVTENAYNVLNELDTGIQPVAAYEMRTKMKSSQIMHEASGEGDASYENLDLTGTECQRINQAAMDWALSVASTSAKTNYLRYGQTIVMGHDAIQENGGLWIYQPLTEKENTEKTVRTITGLALPLDEDHYISIFRDMHYCKLLSPFRALEIIYVDSQYAHGGYQTANELFLQ